MRRPVYAVLWLLVLGATFFIGRLSAPRPKPEMVVTDSLVASTKPAPIVAAPKSESSSSELLDAEATDSPETPDLLAELRKTLKDPVAITRNRRFLELLDGFEAGDGPGIYELFMENNRKGRRYPSEWTNFWTRWGEIEPEVAFDFLTTIPLEDFQVNRLSGLVLPSIGREGEKSSRIFLEKLDLNKKADTAAGAVVIGALAAVNRDAATRIALANSESPLFFQKSLAHITEAAVQSGGAASLIEWYNSLPSDPIILEAALVPTEYRIRRARPAMAQEFLDSLGR